MQCVAWRGSLVAWANDWGVKIYDRQPQTFRFSGGAKITRTSQARQSSGLDYICSSDFPDTSKVPDSLC